MVGVVAAAAELVPALGAAEVHAAAFGQSVLEPAVRTGYKETTQTTEPLVSWTIAGKKPREDVEEELGAD